MIKLYLLSVLASLVMVKWGEMLLHYRMKNDKVYIEMKLILKYQRKHCFNWYIAWLNIKPYIHLITPVWNIILGFISIFITSKISNTYVFIDQADKMLKAVEPHVMYTYPKLFDKYVYDDKRRPCMDVIKDVLEYEEA